VTQFTSKANRLGALGLAVFLLGALVLMSTIDRTLNGIWRVPKSRPWAQRVLVYWAAITLGPLLVAASIGATSVAVTASRGWQGFFGEAVAGLFAVLEFAALGAGLAALYHYVPNTSVRWRHAATGALLAALGLLLGKELLAWYLKAVPTFSLVYGAFATVPILLVWIYMAWLLILLGAVVAAYAPTWESRVRRRPVTPSLQMELALEALAELQAARERGDVGVSQAELAQCLAVDPVLLEPVIGTLMELDVVGELDEAGSPRMVLLRDARQTPAGPLLERLLLPTTPATERLRASLPWGSAKLAQWLPAPRPAPSDLSAAASQQLAGKPPAPRPEVPAA
jgi:membrane protein